jgi:hypothetical protein
LGGSHYSVRDLARLGEGRGEILTMSPATVQRILAAVRLKPHRVRYFLTRTDPQFEEQRAEIVQRYLDPPRHSRVLCLDEKTGIPALERRHPTLPLRPGWVERREFEYLRHGTVKLFAAFEVGTGKSVRSVTSVTLIWNFATSCAPCGPATRTAAGS